MLQVEPQKLLQMEPYIDIIDGPNCVVRAHKIESNLVPGKVHGKASAWQEVVVGTQYFAVAAIDFTQKNLKF